MFINFGKVCENYRLMYLVKICFISVELNVGRKKLGVADELDIFYMDTMRLEGEMFTI